MAAPTAPTPAWTARPMSPMTAPASKVATTPASFGENLFAPEQFAPALAFAFDVVALMSMKSRPSPETSWGTPSSSLHHFVPSGRRQWRRGGRGGGFGGGVGGRGGGVGGRGGGGSGGGVGGCVGGGFDCERVFGDMG